MSQYTLHRWPAKYSVPPHLEEYERVKGDLSIVDGLLIYQDRIVVPTKQRTEVLEILHESHQGLEKCKENARSSVWWPGIGKDLKEMISSCMTCLENKPAQRYEPMKATELPSRPWEVLGTDLCHVKGKNFLVVIDYYSRWLDIKLMTSTTSEAVIRKLREMFATHGIPDVVISDNGPQFISQEFATFASKYGFHHTTSSPYFPHGNAEAERAVQTAKNIIGQDDPDLALLNYRATKHSSTKISPAQALMGRRLKTKVPVLSRALKPSITNDEDIRNADKKAKLFFKNSFDKKHGVRPLEPLDPGDTVLVRTEEKWSRPGKILGLADNNGRSYTVETHSGTIRRNRKDLKMVPGNVLVTCPESTPPKIHQPVERPSEPSEPEIVPPSPAKTARPETASTPTMDISPKKIVKEQPVKRSITTPVRTSSGRLSVFPQKYGQYKVGLVGARNYWAK